MCGREEKCIWDIREKLQHWGISEISAEKIINYLIKEKYVDENRYASFFVNDKIKFNKWGKIKIAYLLRQKGIPDEIVNEVLNETDAEQYFSILCEELKKKSKTLVRENPLRSREKLYRFAASRGFESDLIKKAIQEILKV